MESIIVLAVLAVLFFLVMRKLPVVKKEMDLTKEEEAEGGKVKMNKFEAIGRSVLLKKRRELRKIKEKKGEGYTIQDILDRSEEFMKEKNYADAEKILIGALEIDPTNPKIYSKLGVIYLEQENFSDAKEAFKTALKYDKNNDLLYNNLGLSLFNQGRYIEAVEAYERSIRLNSVVPHRYINLGLSYAALRQYEKALNAYKKALVLDKDNEDYQNLIQEAVDRIAELKNIE